MSLWVQVAISVGAGDAVSDEVSEVIFSKVNCLYQFEGDDIDVSWVEGNGYESS